MEQDQRILDIISASVNSRPADVSEPFTSIVGERITDLVNARRDEIAANFYESAVEEAPAEEADAGIDEADEGDEDNQEAAEGGETENEDS